MRWDDYPSALEDPEIRALMQRIDVHIDAACEAEYPRTFPGRIELTMKDGSVWREFVKTPSGEPDTMLATDELRGKFSLLVRDALGARGEATMLEAITSMRGGAPAAELIRHATPAR